MECYSEQIVAIAADGELEVEETLRLRDHLATCRRCRHLLDALRAETVFSAKACKSFRKRQPARWSSPVRRGLWGGVRRRSWSRCWR